MKHADLIAAATLRIGSFALYEGLVNHNHRADAALSGAAIGTCYVICRSLTSLFGKKISNKWINSSLNENDRTIDKIGPIKAKTYIALWIPTLVITHAIAKSWGSTITPTNLLLNSTISTLFGIALGFSSKILKDNYHYSQFTNKPLLICTIVDR